MKYLFYLLVSMLTITTWAQNEYELKRNDETNRIFYQGVIENNKKSKEELYKMGIAWFESKGLSLEFQDETLSQLMAEVNFSTIGKASVYGKAYHYNFSSELTLEFKDGKTRYTFDHFKKKSSPGEPGTTLETFIENYEPVISSKKSRARQAKMLDGIEIDIDSQIGDLMVDLNREFGPKSESDW